MSAAPIPRSRRSLTHDVTLQLALAHRDEKQLLSQ